MNGSETPLPRPVPAVDELGPLVGKTFGGYEITSYIGEGPTGAVYRAEDLAEQRMAVKVMHKELSRKDAADHLWADLQKLAATGEGCFVKVYDSGFDDEGQFFYAMDELAGSDLESALEESGALAPQRALEIVRQVCRAVEIAHELGVVHGGLKPRNVFLAAPRNEANASVKALDFGAARLAGGADKGVIVGNPFYMAPEQFGGTADVQTDVYALGVLMYELFSGTLPFTGPSHGQVMMRHLAELPQSPPGVDEELSQIILRALVKTPAGRYGSVKQLALALERWAQSMPAMLTDAAGFQVIARAAEARAMKQAALSAPDATTPMPKLDLAELARGTRTRPGDEPTREVLPPMPRSSPGPSPTVVNAVNQKRTNGTENLNSSESVEASLEDFISKANASFPQATSDGWDLHTGDVELLDEAEEQLVQHVAKPAQLPSPRREATPLPAPAPRQVTREPATPEVESAGFEFTPSSGGRRKVERTEVVSSPLPLGVPWLQSPLVFIGGLLAAFIVGAGLVFLMVRSMMPTQPVVVQSPAPAPAAPPVAAVAAQPVAAQPVVTQLPQQHVAAQPVAAQPAAAQPVVTPLPPPVAAPTPTQASHAFGGLASVPAPRKHVASAPTPKKHAAPVAAVPAPSPSRAPARKVAEAPVEKPAPAKKSESPKKGGDWVDPFAQ
jgi:serine/threonine protein kinase